MLDELKKIERSAKEALSQAADMKAFDALKAEWLGRKGALTAVLRALKNMPEGERKRVGAEANRLRLDLEELFTQKERALARSHTEESLRKEWVDVSHPGVRISRGHRHPISLVREDIEDIFKQLGFFIADGPEIEDEFHNFDALNIPKDHPARDAQDTFRIAHSRFVLRTHTSPVQIRYMKTHNPPIRIIAPGRVFRRESTDASHEIQFYQVEGLMVGVRSEGGGVVSIAECRGILGEFFRRFFRKKDIRIQLRPAYFPFVEPGFEVYVSCVVCGGRGCSACKRSGWVEVLGAGMVHPNVFEAVGYVPADVQGFAFGMAIDRLAMMKYRIPDIRLFHAGDMRFLRQF